MPKERGSKFHIKGCVKKISEILTEKANGYVVILIGPVKDEKEEGSDGYLLPLKLQFQSQFHYKDDLKLQTNYFISDVRPIQDSLYLEFLHEKDTKAIFLTSETTEFTEFDSRKENEFMSVGDLLQNKIVIQKNLYKCSRNNQSIFTTYEGIINKVVCRQTGIYEIDSRYELYTTFLQCRADVPLLHEGDEIVIFNAHLEKKKLFCCCSSRIVISKREVDSVQVFHKSLLMRWINTLTLNFESVMWLSSAFIKLKEKFCPTYISVSDILRNQDVQSGIFSRNLLISLLEVKLSDDKSISKRVIKTNRFPLAEFMCQPHKCIFTERKNTPIKISIPTIAEICQLVERRLHWITFYSPWIYGFFGTEDLSDPLVIVGYLNSTKTGKLHLCDSTGHIFVNISNCSNIPCRSIVAIFRATIFVEKVSTLTKEDETGYSLEMTYLEVTEDSLIPLLKIDDFNVGCSLCATDKTLLEEKYCCNISEITLHVPFRKEANELNLDVVNEMNLQPETFATIFIKFIAKTKTFPSLDVNSILFTVHAVKLSKPLISHFHTVRAEDLNEAWTYAPEKEVKMIFKEDNLHLFPLIEERCVYILKIVARVRDFVESGANVVKAFLAGLDKGGRVIVPRHASVLFQQQDSLEKPCFQLATAKDFPGILKTTDKVKALVGIVIDKFYQFPLKHKFSGLDENKPLVNAQLCLKIKDLTSSENVTLYYRTLPGTFPVYGLKHGTYVFILNVILRKSHAKGYYYLLPTPETSIRTVSNAELAILRSSENESEIMNSHIEENLERCFLLKEVVEDYCVITVTCMLTRITKVRFFPCCSKCKKGIKITQSVCGSSCSTVTVKAQALVSDGSASALAIITGENVKKLLCFSDAVWNAIIFYVHSKQQSVCFEQDFALKSSQANDAEEEQESCRPGQSQQRSDIDMLLERWCRKRSLLRDVQLVCRSFTPRKIQFSSGKPTSKPLRRLFCLKIMDAPTLPDLNTLQRLERQW